MYRSSLSRLGVALVAVCGAATAANATLFSFASDVNSNAYTFRGTGASGGAFTLSDFSRPNTFTLLVDDDNGTRPTVSIPVEFRANLTANTGTSTNVAGSLFQYSYRITGSFGFYDAMGNALMTATVGPSAAILTVPGTSSAWSTSGAVIGADSFADITYTFSQAFINALGGATAANGYGINGTGNSVGPDDFSFTLTAINGGTMGQGVAVDANTHLPTGAWQAESSFSGSSLGGVPTPGAMGLLGLGGLLVLRRRTR